MAKVDFNSLEASSNNSVSSNVGFFSLKNDKDEAVVRFMEDSTSDFEILTTHPITVNGKYRSINCIREANDPIETCPICGSGAQINRRIFVKMIQYTTENGTVVARPVVWERPLAFAYDLKSYIDNYGPLSDIICKITRNGAPRDPRTRYSISQNLSKSVYRDDIYVCDRSLFENYSALGTIVLNKSKEEMESYLKTGNFPGSQSVSNNYQTTQEPVYTSTPQPQYNNYNETQSFGSQPSMAPQTPPQRMPWENNQTFSNGVERPTRYY